MNLYFNDFNQFIEEFCNCNDKVECQNIIRRICLDIFKNENESYNGCVLDKSFLTDFSKGLLADFLNFLFDSNNKHQFTFDFLSDKKFIDYISNNDNDLLGYNKINDFISASDFIKKDIINYINNSIMLYTLKIKTPTTNDIRYEKIDANNTKFEFNGTFFEKENIQLFNIKISKFNIFSKDLEKAKKFIKEMQDLYSEEDIKKICANLLISYVEEWYDEEYTFEDIYNSLENTAMEVNVDASDDTLSLSIWFNLKENSKIDFGGHNPMLELHLDKTRNSCGIE